MIRVGDLKNLYTVLNQTTLTQPILEPRYRQKATDELICAQIKLLLSQEESKPDADPISESTFAELKNLASQCLLIDYLISFHQFWKERPRLVAAILTTESIEPQKLIPALSLLTRVDEHITQKNSVKNRHQALNIWLPRTLAHLEKLQVEAAITDDLEFFSRFIKIVTETKPRPQESSELLINKLSPHLNKILTANDLDELPKPPNFDIKNLINTSLSLFTIQEMCWLSTITDDDALRASYIRLYFDRVKFCISKAKLSGIDPSTLDFKGLKALLPQDALILETQSWKLTSSFLLADYYGNDRNDITKTKSDFERTSHLTFKSSKRLQPWLLGTMDKCSTEDRWKFFENLLKQEVDNQKLPQNVLDFFLKIFNQNGITFDTTHALMVRVREMFPEVLHLSVDSNRHRLEISISGGGINVSESLICDKVVLPFDNPKTGFPTWSLEDCEVTVEHRYRIGIDPITDRPYRQVLSYHVPQMQIDSLGTTPFERKIHSITEKAQNTKRISELPPTEFEDFALSIFDEAKQQAKKWFGKLNFK